MSRFTSVPVSSSRWTGQSIYEALQNGQMIINSDGYGVPDTLIRMDVSGMVQTDGYFTQLYDTTNPRTEGLVPSTAYNGYGQRFPLLQREFNSKYIWFMLNNNIGGHGMYKASYIYLQNSNGRFAKIDGENVGMIGQGVYNPGKSGPERYVAGQIDGNDYGYWRGRSDLNMRLVMRMEDDTIDDVLLDDSSFRMIQGDVIYYNNIFATEQNQMPDNFWIDLKPYNPGPAVACQYTGSNGYTMRTVTPLQLIYSGIKVFTSREEGDEWLMNMTPSGEETLGIANHMSSVLCMDSGVLNHIADDILFNDDPTVADAVLDGLKLYGQNPADCIIDLYYCPFNPISHFVSVYGSRSNITLGNYGPVSIGGYTEINTIKTYNCGSMDFSLALGTYPIYNDWRDFVSYDMYIYLPYAGFYHLDVQKYMHKTLTLKVMFDVRTGNLKYYVFSGSTITDMFEGVVRMNVPITSSDKVAAANMFTSTAGNPLSIIPQFLASGVKSFSKNLVEKGGVGIIPDMVKGTETRLNAPVPLTTSGGFSGSSNLFDDTTPKIILEYQPYVYDDTIKPNYGIADNTYAQFSTITGYMEAENVKLVSTQTAVRQEMLKQCLAEGCIL